ncbi:MAG: hypothetical protein V8T87_01280 [Victivallales bacterium]
MKNSGAEAVQKAVGEAVDFFEFLFMKETEGQDIALPAVKTKVAENLLKFIMLFENAVARDSYLQWLAGKTRAEHGSHAFRGAASVCKGGASEPFQA